MTPRFPTLIALFSFGCTGRPTPEGAWSGSCDLLFDLPGLDAPVPGGYDLRLDISVDRDLATAIESVTLPQDGTTLTANYDGTWIDPELHLEDDDSPATYDLFLSADLETLIGDYESVDPTATMTGDCELTRTTASAPPVVPAVAEPTSTSEPTFETDLGSFDIADPGSQLQLVRAELAPYRETFGMYGEIENTGTDWACFVEVSLDLSPRIVDTYATGSVRSLGEVQTNTCIGPGEVGQFYIWDYESDTPADEVDVVGVSFDWSPEAATGDPTASLNALERSLTLEDCEIVVNVKNTGSATAEFPYDLAGEVYAFRENGSFLDFGFCGPSGASSVPAGDTETLDCSLILCDAGPAYDAATFLVLPSWD